MCYQDAFFPSVRPEFMCWSPEMWIFEHSTVLTDSIARARSEQITALNVRYCDTLQRGRSPPGCQRQTLTTSSGQKLNVVTTYQITRRHNTKTVTQSYQHFSSGTSCFIPDTQNRAGLRSHDFLPLSVWPWPNNFDSSPPQPIHTTWNLQSTS
jgi:hypothetical protein